MNRNDLMGEILEKGQGAVKTVKKQVSDTAKQVASQVAGNQPGKVDENFVKDLYGVKNKQATSDKQEVKSPPQETRSMEEQQKLAKLRQELHMSTYYEPTFNPPKQKEEERPAEKVKQEKKEEQLELQKKEEKKAPPPAVKKAQTSTEIHRGVSG